MLTIPICNLLYAIAKRQISLNLKRKMVKYLRWEIVRINRAMCSLHIWITKVFLCWNVYNMVKLTTYSKSQVQSNLCAHDTLRWYEQRTMSKACVAPNQKYPNTILHPFFSPLSDDLICTLFYHQILWLFNKRTKF